MALRDVAVLGRSAIIENTPVVEQVGFSCSLYPREYPPRGTPGVSQ